MKYKEISIGVSQKVNMGNFESKGIGLTATAELIKGEDLIRVKQELANRLSQMLEFEVKKLKEGGQK